MTTHAVSSHTVGEIDHDAIVRQLVWTARINDLRAEDVATFDETKWGDLMYRAFGGSFGSVRVGVLVALHEQDDEIREARRQRAQVSR